MTAATESTRAASWKGLPKWLLEDAGVTVDAEGLVRLPYRLTDGTLYAHRVVAPAGRRWWEPGDGREAIPFGLDRLELPQFRTYAVLVIAEGESDALAARLVPCPCRLDVLGIPGAGTWRVEWTTYCRGYAGVYVAGDGDEAGRALNAAVCADVPEARALPIPDGSDLRELLSHNQWALMELISLTDAEAERRDAWQQARSYDDLYERLEAIEQRLAA